MNKVEKIKERLGWLRHLDIIAAGTVLVSLVILTLVGALSRYILDKPFTWMEEVQLMLEVWVVFLGAGYGFRVGSHVAIEIIIESLPAKVQKVFDFIIFVIVIGTLLYLLVQSVGYFNLFVRSGRVTSILQIPYKYIYGIVPVCCVLMLSNYLYVFVRKLHGVDIVKEVSEF
jgi:TRAP-type C4-dicarboxylate transport system permease small subunit